MSARVPPRRRWPLAMTSGGRDKAFGCALSKSVPARPRLFTIPAGAPFLPTLARALLDGPLIPGFPGAAPRWRSPSDVYLPTQRAARAFRARARRGERRDEPRPAAHRAARRLRAEGDACRGRARRRPARRRRARPADDAGAAARAWGEALNGAIRRVGAHGRIEFDESEPPLVAAARRRRSRSRGDLAALIDDMIIEGVGLGAARRPGRRPLRPLLAHHARLPQDRVRAWPAWLAEHGLVDRATRAAQAVEARDRGAGGRRGAGPTIIAGSTGTNARPRGSSAPSRARRRAPSCCPISTRSSTTPPGG